MWDHFKNLKKWIMVLGCSKNRIGMPIHLQLVRQVKPFCFCQGTSANIFYIGSLCIVQSYSLIKRNDIIGNACSGIRNTANLSRCFLRKAKNKIAFNAITITIFNYYCSNNKMTPLPPYSQKEANKKVWLNCFIV